MLKKLCLLLTITATALMISCSDDSSNDPSDKSDYYFEATIDGSKVYIDFEDASIINGTTQSGNQVNQVYQFGCGTGFYNSSSFDELASVQLLQEFESVPDAEQIESMFAVQFYDYGISVTTSYANVRDGALVKYTDANGTVWTTDKGTAPLQTGSTFEITEFKTNSSGGSKKIFTCKFSCMLYDGNGNSKKLENGECTGRVIE